MRIGIRKANPADLEWIIKETAALDRFFGTKRSLLEDESVARAKLLEAIENHLFLVSEGECGPTGFIAGLVTPHPFNPKLKILALALWWVRPEFRFTHSAQLLIDVFTKLGRDFADWIIFSLGHKCPINERSILRRGYKLQERCYLMEVR